MAAAEEKAASRVMSNGDCFQREEEKEKEKEQDLEWSVQPVTLSEPNPGREGGVVRYMLRAVLCGKRT